MSEPLADWLALREAADFASRSKRLTRIVTDRFHSHQSVRVLDLATGTGSNIRYLLEHLPPRQHWIVVDRDSSLLARLVERTAGWAEHRGYAVKTVAGELAITGRELDCRITAVQRNLSSPDDGELFHGRDLVTASALLDLVSDAWLQAVATHCRAAEAAALFTLTYDGRSPCAPADTDDDLVRALFNQHQRTDKGLGGIAEGPNAAEAAARAFADHGFRVEREQSDWVLEPSDAALQRQLIAGWAEAATEMAPEIRVQIANWKLRRLRHVDEGNSLVIVGHEDLVATP